MRFLVVRRDNIGDLVCTTPLLAGLRQAYPEAVIEVLVSRYTRDVLDCNPDVDAVHAYTKAKHRSAGESRWGVYCSTVRLLMALRAKRFDFAILATPSYRRHDLIFARLAGARQVIGFVERSGQGIEVGVLRGASNDLHEVEDVWRLAAPLGITGAPPGLRVIPAADRVEAVWRELPASLLRRRGALVALHISARKPSQRWPMERFADLARQLHERHGAVFMVLWSPGGASNPLHPGDDDQADALERLVADVPTCMHRTERLADLIAALSACDAVVCSDGGAMHLAAALGKPLLCFFGKSSAARWRPWKTLHQLLQARTLEATDISVQEAAAAFDRLLEECETLRRPPTEGR